MTDRVFKYKPHIRLARKGELNEGLWIVNSSDKLMRIKPDTPPPYMSANNFANWLNRKYRTPVAQSSSSPAHNVGMQGARPAKTALDDVAYEELRRGTGTGVKNRVSVARYRV